MNLIVIVFTSLTIIIHFLVFLAESLLWLNPIIYERVVLKIAAPTDIPSYEQARILELLFFNQGFYNLFVALGGIAGFTLFKTGKREAGITLICYSCLFAFGAGTVLAFSSKVYPGAIVQGLPPLLALLGLYIEFKREK